MCVRSHPADLHLYLSNRWLEATCADIWWFYDDVLKPRSFIIKLTSTFSTYNIFEHEEKCPFFSPRQIHAPPGRKNRRDHRNQWQPEGFCRHLGHLAQDHSREVIVVYTAQWVTYVLPDMAPESPHRSNVKIEVLFKTILFTFPINQQVLYRNLRIHVCAGN